MSEVAALGTGRASLAPGVIPMVAWTTVMVLLVGPVLWLIPHEGRAMWLAAGLWASLLVVAGTLAHLSYRKAKQALATRPGLGGGEIVRSLWWVAAIALFVIPPAMAIATK